MSGKRKSAAKSTSKSAKDFDSTLAIKCLLIGVLGSILLIGSYVVLELIWTGLIVYNESLKSLFLCQMALLIVLIPVFAGALAAWSAASYRMRFNGDVTAGLIAGITGSFGFIVALSTLILTLNVSRRGLLGWSTIHGMVFPVLTTGMLAFFTDILFALMFALLSMMLSAIGGGIFFILSYYAGKGALRKLLLTDNARVLTTIVVVLLAIAILPPAIAYAGEQSGIVAGQRFVEPVGVQRISDDTLLFTNNGGDWTTGFDQGSPPLVYISTGGSFVKDMTDQQAATKDMMNITLEPASGLGWAKGSTLKVKGQSIADLAYTDNTTGTKMVHVIVAGMSTDGQELIILDKSV